MQTLKGDRLTGGQGVGGRHRITLFSGQSWKFGRIGIGDLIFVIEEKEL